MITFQQTAIQDYVSLCFGEVKLICPSIVINPPVSVSLDMGLPAISLLAFRARGGDLRAAPNAQSDGRPSTRDPAAEAQFKRQRRGPAPSAGVILTHSSPQQRPKLPDA